MKISIIIKCKDDEKVFDCIKSIDEDVEVIVSMPSNKKIQKKLKKLGAKHVLAPVGNLAVTSNIGIKNASYQKVIITDSDTLFQKGCIRSLFKALDSYQVARARIIYPYRTNRFLSKVIAETRDYFNSFPVAYTPGLALNKDIISKISGFYFNKHVAWAEDADLNYRIQKANIPVIFAKGAYVKHGSVNFLHDLRAAFRIGTGKRASVEYSDRPFGKNPFYRVKNTFYDVKQKKGIKVALYFLLWRLFYYLGYYCQNFFHVYD